MMHTASSAPCSLMHGLGIGGAVVASSVVTRATVHQAFTRREGLCGDSAAYTASSRCLTAMVPDTRTEILYIHVII